MIPLKEAVRRNRPRVRSVTFREIAPTKAQSDTLAAIYLDVVRLWRDVGARCLTVYDPPALTTDTQPEIDAVLTQGQNAANALTASLSIRLDGWAAALAAWHSRKWAANVLAASGVRIDGFLSSAVIADDLAASLNWNKSLIRNVSDQTRDRIANIVWSGWRARTPRNVIARQINEAVGLGVKRARFIASDQTTKLSAALDESRMLEAGLDEWIWRHSGKAHPRLDHLARNGKRYTYKTAPDDLPGELPFCGCKKQAYLDLS